MMEDNRFNQYKRKEFSEMRPYEKGEDLTKISVADVDNPETDMGYVARNPKNHNDQWYVAAMSNENINVSTSINYYYQEVIIKVVPGVYSIRILSK